jgi:hypothetical protein
MLYSEGGANRTWKLERAKIDQNFAEHEAETTANAEAITSLQSGKLQHVSTISALQAFDRDGIEQLQLTGPASGLFEWEDGNADDDDGAFTIASDSDTPGRWVRQHSGGVSVELFGAVGDVVTDDTAAITACAAYCKVSGRTLIIPAGLVCKITSTVDLRHITLQIDGAIEVAFTDAVGVIVGGNATSRNNPKQFIKTVRYSASITAPTELPTYATIRAIGVKGQDLTIWATTFFELYADTTTGSTLDYSSAYSRISLGYVKYVQLNGQSSTVGGSAWINENDFYLTSCKYVKIVATHADGGTPYNHNNNRFHGGAFEGVGYGGKNLELEHRSSNRFYETRFESSSGISFGAESKNNEIQVAWYSSGQVGNSDLVLSDLGIGNTVRHAPQVGVVTENILALTPDLLDNKLAGVTNIVADGNKMTATAWQYIYESPFLPCRTLSGSSNTAVFVGMFGRDNTSSGVRVYVEAYDENFQQITTSTDDDFVWSGGNTVSFVDPAATSASTNTQYARGWITRAGVDKASYFKIIVRNGSVSSTFERLSVRYMVPKSYHDTIDIPPCNMPSAPDAEYNISCTLTTQTIAAGATHKQAFTMPVGSTLAVSGWHGTVLRDSTKSYDAFMHSVVITGDNAFELWTTNISGASATLPASVAVRVLLRATSEAQITL